MLQDSPIAVHVNANRNLFEFYCSILESIVVVVELVVAFDFVV